MSLGILILLVYVLLLLCMFRSGYSVSLCCSVYCLCVNVYFTTATRCQLNCTYQIYRNISYNIICIGAGLFGRDRRRWVKNTKETGYALP